MPRQRRKCRNMGGFSLLEILVAFAILALSIGVLLNIFSRGLRTAMVSEELQQAIGIAESQMARAGIEIEAGTGALNGIVDDKYTWSLQGTPYIPPQVKTDVPPQPLEASAFKIQVRVTWQEGAETKEVVLNSVRLAKTKL